MGNTGSKYDIHDLELAFWYARLRCDGDLVKSGELAEEISYDLLSRMAGAKDHGLSLIQDLIAEHPDAEKLPFFGDASQNTSMSELVKARDWIAGGPKPVLTPLLSRQIELAAVSNKNKGKAYIDGRIRKRAVASYTTRRGQAQLPQSGVKTYEETVQGMEDVRKLLEERHHAQGQKAIDSDHQVVKARAQNAAWVDPRVRTALKNAAVTSILNDIKH